ncbi:hypothetical protein M422DRAFT_237640, partial [Sphaerobolus stellatus SS14]
HHRWPFYRRSHPLTFELCTQEFSHASRPSSLLVTIGPSLVVSLPAHRPCPYHCLYHSSRHSFRLPSPSD